MPFYSKVLETSCAKHVDKELRASHAGETGAVWIYRGALCAEFLLSLFIIGNRPSKTKPFIHEHLKTEKSHLAIFEHEMPLFRGSFLLPAWIAAGFVTGLLPRLLGHNWFFYTIYCVEQFVDKHYEKQCSSMIMLSEPPSNVINRFKECQIDEQHHRDEALSLMTEQPTLLMTLWGKLVGSGSSLAVAMAKLI
jgi:ubiquinone biosynthesis monooxygenase Coq7